MRSPSLHVALLFSVALASFACGAAAKKTTCQNECSTAGATSCDGTKQRTCTKGADGCFKLQAAAECPSGQTCQGSACACTTTCGGTCCNAGAACIDGACCDTPCGATCGCEDPQVCAINGDGIKACGYPCTNSGSCLNSAPEGMTCCTVQPDNTGACLPPPTDATKHMCRCRISPDCGQGGACSPSSPQGVGGPYVCSMPGATQPGPGDACDGLHICGSGYECWQDTGDIAFCTNACDNDAECSTGSCCVKSPNSFCTTGSCTKSGGCMRCP